MAYHAPRIAHEDSYALQLLGVVLSEGKTSRFYQRLVEREQSVTFANADYGESKDPSLFHIRAEARTGHAAEEVEASIHDELDHVSRNGVTHAEVERAKHQIEAHFILSRERTLDQAILLGQIETLGGLAYIDNYLQKIGEVTSEDISRVCAHYLSADNRTVGWLVSDGHDSGDDSGDEMEDGVED
jgi:predicted Zn-dependent peptidase